MLRTSLFKNTKVEETGFLPSTQPLNSLPETTAYQARINAIINNLPSLLKEKKLRAAVDALNAEFPNPELKLEKGNKAQKNAALCFLTSIAQAYVCEDTSKPIEHLPAAIAKPLYALAKSRQRFPMITYTDYVLNNWRLVDETKPVSLDNIDTIVSFSGTKDEAWFVKIHVAIEAVSAKAITAAQTAYHESLKETPDASVIEQSLRAITESLNQSIDLMHNMKDNCDPEVFWNVLRPYLGGWEKVKPVNCDDAGVRFEGISTRDTKPFAFGGPSGAQSSIVPALDTALKIKHDIDGMHKKLLEFKEYMPNQHQAFILQFTNSKIKSVAKHSGNAELVAAYDDAVSAVKRMRGAHLGLVHAYIYKPAGNQGIPAHVITGTGGAPIQGYLGGRFTDTHTLTEHMQTPSKRF